MIADKPTARIPVIKKGNIYTLSFTGTIWNKIMILLLEGALKSGVILEFDIKEEENE